MSGLYLGNIIELQIKEYKRDFHFSHVYRKYEKNLTAWRRQYSLDLVVGANTMNSIKYFKLYYISVVFFFLLPLQSQPFVKRVVDGDTLLLSSGERVRLIGVDTPEVHESQKLHRDASRTGQDVKTIKQLGKRSSEFVKKVIAGKEVILEYNQMQRDKNGRLLAYVWFHSDSSPPGYDRYLKVTGNGPWQPGQKLNLNALVLQCGFAHVYTRFPFKYMDDFRKYEREARQAELGLWSTVEGLSPANIEQSNSDSRGTYSNGFLTSQIVKAVVKAIIMALKQS